MKSKFAKNVGIMGVVGILIKVIGALYRIPLFNFISEEAVGYYSLAYPWYTFLITISSVSVTAALAKLVAEAQARNDVMAQREIYTVSLWLMRFFGIASSLVLIGGAKGLAHLVKTPETVYSFYVLGATVLFVCLNAVYRGFFQGYQKLELLAFNQLTEQLVRAFLGLTAVVVLSRWHLGDAFLGGAATSGAFFGAVACWLASKAVFRKKIGISKVAVSDFKGTALKMLRIMLPIAAGAAILPLLGILDSIMAPRLLSAIGMGDRAPVLYAYVSAYSAPIVNLTQIVFTALALSLLPLIAESFVQKRKELFNQAGLGILLSLVLGLPMGLGIAVLAEPILSLLYYFKSDVAPHAAPVLATLGIGSVFLSVYMATTSILQGINAYRQPVRHMLIGAVIKVLMGFVLIQIPSINILGVALSTLAAYAVAATLNVRLLVQRLQFPKGLLKKVVLTLGINGVLVLLARGLYGATAGVLEGFTGVAFSVLCAVAGSACFYVCAILGLKVVTKADIQQL